jgi:hypothetical protein
MTWSAEITNDPTREHDLYVELLEDDEYRGRIFRKKDGELVLVVYEREGVEIPLMWLRGLIERAEKDL